MLMLSGSVVAVASSTVRDCLLVHMVSGGSVAFPLSEMPVITFSGSVVTIATERYQLSDVRKYTFADYASAVGSVAADGTSAGEYSNDGHFFCIRLKNASVPVRLRTLGGVEVPIDMNTDADGVLRIDMRRLGHEVYLLTVGNETIKIKGL